MSIVIYIQVIHSYRLSLLINIIVYTLRIYNVIKLNNINEF